MKRTLIFVLTLVLIFVTCVSCTSFGEGGNTTNAATMNKTPFEEILLIVSSTDDGKYEVLEGSDFDQSSEAEHSNEISVSFEKYKNRAAEKTKSQKIGGVTVNGTYSHSIKSDLYMYDIDCYSYRDDNVNIDFGINKADGKCYTYSWVDFNYAKNAVGSKKLDQDKCEEIARTYMEQYVEDNNAYDTENITYRSIPEYEGIYVFEFVRKVNGIPTSEKIYVTVTVYGKVSSHRMIMPGAFKDYSVSNNYRDSALISSLNAKIYDIYSVLYEENECEHKIADVELIRLSNNKFAYKYIIETAITPKNINAKGYVEMAELVLIIE